LLSRGGRTAVIVVALFAGVARSAETGPLPYTLAVDVLYGEPKGPESLRDEIRLRIVQDLTARAWFKKVVEFGGDGSDTADVVLNVTLDDLRRETHYSTSMAARQEQDDPISRQQFTVEFSVDVTVDLFVMPDGVALRSTRLRESYGRPPRYPGEDTEAAIREEALVDLVQSVRRAAFKGSAEKLGREIERQREHEASTSR
jgi:hypothetical protein